MQLVCGFPEAAKPVLVAVYIETLHQNVLILNELLVIGQGLDRTEFVSRPGPWSA